MSLDTAFQGSRRRRDDPHRQPEQRQRPESPALGGFPLVHATHNTKAIRDALRREVCAYFCFSFLFAMKPDAPLPLARRSV